MSSKPPRKKAAKKQASKMGRKTIRTPENRQKLGDMVALGYSNDTACQAVPIGKSSLYDWLKAEPDFSDYLKSRKAEALKFYAGKLMEAAKGGKLAAIIFWLKTHAEEFRENAPIVIEGEDGTVKIRTHVIEVTKRDEPDAIN